MSYSTIVVQPSKPHTHTVVFLHGRGDNAQNFAASLAYSRDSRNRTLADAFPSFRWVFPQAKVGQSVAFPGGAVSQWFDIWNVSDFSEREGIQAEGLRESVAGIREIIASEARLLEGRWSRIVLAGISQGAATSVHTLLNLDLPQGEDRLGAATSVHTLLNLDLPQGEDRLGAFLGFSCRMPFPGRTLAETRAVLGLRDVPEGDILLRQTPMLLEHCVDDPLVLVGNGRVLRDTLLGFGAQVEWKEYLVGGHWFNSPAGIDDAVKFLESQLG